MSIFAHAGYWTDDMTVDEFVGERSKIASQHKADGVMSSPLELPAIRAAVTRPDFIVVTPGCGPWGARTTIKNEVGVTP
jgi:orotidine-5'-phosphate decarboxylase